MWTRRLCAVGVLLVSAAALAQTPASAPAPAASPAPEAAPIPTPAPLAKPDLATGLDPYDPAAERVRFLTAAGVDNEIEPQEFEDNRGKTDPFVRKFDRWDDILRYDKDRNGRIDWFEADAYRQGQRLALMLAFDVNKDGVLRAAEREAAIRALESDNGFRQIAAQAARAGWGRGGDGSVYTPADYKTLLGKFDKDGDGKLSGEEWTAARQYQREERRQWDSIERVIANFVSPHFNVVFEG